MSSSDHEDECSGELEQSQDSDEEMYCGDNLRSLSLNELPGRTAPLAISGHNRFKQQQDQDDQMDQDTEDEEVADSFSPNGRPPPIMVCHTFPESLLTCCFQLSDHYHWLRYELQHSPEEIHGTAPSHDHRLPALCEPHDGHHHHFYFGDDLSLEEHVYPVPHVPLAEPFGFQPRFEDLNSVSWVDSVFVF